MKAEFCSILYGNICKDVAEAICLAGIVKSVLTG